MMDTNQIHSCSNMILFIQNIYSCLTSSQIYNKYVEYHKIQLSTYGQKGLLGPLSPKHLSLH